MRRAFVADSGGREGGRSPIVPHEVGVLQATVKPPPALLPDRAWPRTNAYLVV